MPDQRARAPIAVSCAVLALSAVAIGAAWGSGSWTAEPTPRTTPIAIPALPGSYPLGSALTAWCSIEPGEDQQALLNAMGQPTRQGAAGTGHELWLNVTPQPLLSLVEAVMPMHRSDGYAIWRRGSYLLADTYARSGSISRMDAWQVEVVAKRTLRCSFRRGQPFGPVTVPYVVGRTISAAVSELHDANLVPSIPPISTAQTKVATVGRQSPVAGTSVVAGTAVRLTPTAAAALAANSYPAEACESAHPTALLLPASTVPGLRLSFAPSAYGGGTLSPMALVLPGQHPKSPPSAAVINEHLRDVTAPRTAIQNANPYYVSHPRTITTSDEAITGFTNRHAEGLFYSLAQPQTPPPEERVNGRLVFDHVTHAVNVAWMPKPNEVVTDALPGTDVPATVTVTVEAGRTILGLDFEGGSRLTVRDVRPYVLQAIRQIVDRCSSMDIMATVRHG